MSIPVEQIDSYVIGDYALVLDRDEAVLLAVELLEKTGAVEILNGLVDSVVDNRERVFFRYENSVLSDIGEIIDRKGLVTTIRRTFGGTQVGILEEWNSRDGVHPEPKFKWFRAERIYSVDREAEIIAAGLAPQA